MWQLLADPGPDAEGAKRAQLAAALRDSSDPRAVEVLLETLAQPMERQPTVVHRQAVTSLGALRVKEAVDPILVALFTIPDAPTTTSLAERAKVAIASIGDGAVPSLVAMLKGEHPGVRAQAEANGVPEEVVRVTAASMLAAFDHPNATAALLEQLEAESCVGDSQSGRSVLTNVLGHIGHAAAAPAICRCLADDHDPGTAFVAAEALGFIGGPEATTCLVEAVKTGSYDPEIVDEEVVYELRWEAVRFAALAGGAAAVPKIRSALARNRDATVKKKAGAFAPMLDMLERCNDEAQCLDAVLADPDADPFAREAAAHVRSRQDPESAELALVIGRAFAIPDPDVRVSVAILTRRVAPAHGCTPCGEALRDVMEREKAGMPVIMQASVLAARTTMAVVSEDPALVPFVLPAAP